MMGGGLVAVVDASIPSSFKYQSVCRDPVGWLVSKMKSASFRY